MAQIANWTLSCQGKSWPSAALSEGFLALSATAFDKATEQASSARLMSPLWEAIYNRHHTYCSLPSSSKRDGTLIGLSHALQDVLPFQAKMGAEGPACICWKSDKFKHKGTKELPWAEKFPWTSQGSKLPDDATKLSVEQFVYLFGAEGDSCILKHRPWQGCKTLSKYICNLERRVAGKRYCMRMCAHFPEPWQSPLNYVDGIGYSNQNQPGTLSLQAKCSISW